VPTIKALVAALGLRSAAKNRVLGKAAQRWSGIWMLLLILDVMRFFRRRRSQVIARRVLKDGEVLVISSSVNRERQ
jgi:hypothetical protein